jgi:hypothetical protein
MRISDDERAEAREAAKQKLEGYLNYDGATPPVEPDKNSHPLVAFGYALILAIPFVIVGSLIILLLTISPILQWMDADSWPGVDCTILYSGLRMEYAYVWEEEEYISNQYDFASFFRFTSERDSQRYTDGQAARCFVNPSFPSEAVLSKSFNLEYLSGLAGLPFLLVGLFFAYMFGKDAVRDMIYPSSLDRSTNH